MTHKTPSYSADEIKLSDLFEILWSYKVFIVFFVLISSSATVFYTLNMPDEYTAEGIYMPKNDDSSGGLSSLAGQLGGVASLAGFDMSGSESKTEVALELLHSRAFLQDFIARHDLVAPLFAASGWNKEKNELIYNTDIYDPDSDEWTRVVPKGKSIKPTPWEAFEYLKNRIQIVYDSKKNMVEISLTYYSPYIAKEWLTLLVKDTNDFWKQKKLTESKRYIELLSSKIEDTQLSDIKEVFYGIIAEQTKTNLLTQATEESMFETVAEVVLPESKSAPSRALLCVVGFVFSAFFACVISLFLGIAKKREQLYGHL